MFYSRDEAFNHNLILAVFRLETHRSTWTNLVKYVHMVWCKDEWIRGLVSKETMVLRRRGVETNVWFYQQC